MSKPDFALVTIRTHSETGWLQMVDWRREPGDTDINLRAPNDLSLFTIDLRGTGPIDCERYSGDIAKNPQAVSAGAKRWTEALKIAHSANLHVLVGSAVGGEEDVIDCTDLLNVDIEIEKGAPRGLFFSTLKGGLKDFSLKVGQQIGHGKETDHDLGNWFDFNKRKSTGISLDVVTFDGSKPRCRVLHSDRPTLPPGQPWDVCVPWYRPIFIPMMTIAKKLHIA